jgi:hypothetical protein
LDTHEMPGAKWFEGARLNLAEHMFRHHPNEPERPAILSRSEIRELQTLTWGRTALAYCFPLLCRYVRALLAQLEFLDLAGGGLG